MLKSDCLCGRKHRYGNCYYLNKDFYNRLSDFSEDSAVRQRTNQILRDDPTLQARISKSPNEINKRFLKATPATMAIYLDDNRPLSNRVSLSAIGPYSIVREVSARADDDSDMNLPSELIVAALDDHAVSPPILTDT